MSGVAFPRGTELNSTSPSWLHKPKKSFLNRFKRQPSKGKVEVPGVAAASVEASGSVPGEWRGGLRGDLWILLLVVA